MLELVGAQEQDRVVELARHRERPPRGAGATDRGEVRRAAPTRGAVTVIVAVRAVRSIATSTCA